jgi:hypothetical protein
MNKEKPKWNKEYVKQYNKEYILKNKERLLKRNMEYYLNNKKILNEKRKEYRLKNKDLIREKSKKYYFENGGKEVVRLYKLKNFEKLKIQQREYRLKNKERLSKLKKEYDKNYWLNNKKIINEKLINKRKTDIRFRLLCNLRIRMNKVLKGTLKSNSTVKLLGCSIYDFKKHMESLFQPWMSWENYGKWHIDHIKPCALFDLTLPEQQRECFHWSNMRPLEAIENIKKGKKYEQTKS